MSSKIYSAAIVGLDAELVEVEADIGSALPKIIIVGLPDKAVDEAKERVRSALKNSGVSVPRRQVTVNLAPARIKKVGSGYDLPIAISILNISSQLELGEAWSKQLFIGELSLSGTLRPVTGMLPIAIMAKQRGIEILYVPEANAREAHLIPGLTIIPVRHLRELVEHLKGLKVIAPFFMSPQNVNPQGENDLDISHIRGQEHAKRVLEIAAAGAHNVLFSGPPGTGKTMLAKALATILPAMTLDESLEVSKIYSIAGLLTLDQPLITMRPFRNPHHTSSGIALIGGGTLPRPGEISLAHRGVLFLDEFAEFARSVLENLRQPLEDGIICISRASCSLRFPAKFMLVASMNPCPCGFLNAPNKRCDCTYAQILKYQKRVSGPLLDRIDIHTEVPAVPFEKLTSEARGESSKTIQKRVQQARDIQLKRFVPLRRASLKTNADMNVIHVKSFCQLDSAGMSLMRQAVTNMKLSARAYHRILKLARTIADLEDEEKILPQYVSEAVQYRKREE